MNTLGLQMHYLLRHLPKITNRSFQHAAPRLWNKLPRSFREPHPHSGLSPSHNPTQIGSTLSSPRLSPSITPSLFTLNLKHTSSSSLFHRRLHHRYTGLISRTLGRTVFLLLIGFVLVFKFSAKRGRLSIY